MIDIVITYLNERDKQWSQAFKFWKDKEIIQGKSYKGNRQAFGAERTREWDILKYWFRGVENNCKWVNKIFFVVQNERHIPKWLNRNNPKLRIVYHNEFIPEELLPTFNTNTIQMYLCNIQDLSKNYITCDDDFYFINPIEETKFFRDNKPVQPNNEIPYQYYDTNSITGEYWGMLNSNMDFVYKITGQKKKYGIYHLPEARNKDFELKILKDNWEYIKGTLIDSKFRSKKNLCSCVYNDLMKIYNETYIDDPYKNSEYCCLMSNVDFNKYANKEMVCFNDTEVLDDYELTKKKLISFLKNKFPNKSSYEV